LYDTSCIRDTEEKTFFSGSEPALASWQTIFLVSFSEILLPSKKSHQTDPVKYHKIIKSLKMSDGWKANVISVSENLSEKTSHHFFSKIAFKYLQSESDHQLETIDN